MPESSSGIIRVVHDREHPYVMVSRALAQQRGLSYEARGLMLYLLSKPKDWQARMADLQAEGAIKRTALRSILHELEAAGYLVRERVWNPETKRLTWITNIYETPPAAERQGVDFQPIADQPVAVQAVADPPIYIVETVHRTETQKKDAPAVDTEELLEIERHIRTFAGKHRQTVTPEHVAALARAAGTLARWQAVSADARSLADVQRRMEG